MSKIKVLDKGYRVEVVSWENDGDFYRTESKSFETLPEARAVKEFLELLMESKYDFMSKGIGNSMEDDCSEISYRVLQYLSEASSSELLFPDLLDRIKQRLFEVFPDEVDESNWKEFVNELCLSIDEENMLIIDLRSLATTFTGYSECYLFRVVESVKIFYHSEDVYAEEVL